MIKLYQNKLKNHKNNQKINFISAGRIHNLKKYVWYLQWSFAELNNFGTLLNNSGTELNIFGTEVNIFGIELNNFVSDLNYFGTELNKFVQNQTILL